MLYADDLVIMSDSGEDLQLGLDLFHDYCERWLLSVNLNKSAIVIFRKGGKVTQNDHYYYGDKLLHVLDSYSYLGVELSYTGKFLKLQDALASSGTRALYSLYRVLKNMYDPNVSLQCSLFDKLVHPVIDYSCEVWGFHKVPAVEKLHLQYCKRILHVKRSTANFFVYGELGRYPMYIGRFVKIIKFWIKII